MFKGVQSKDGKEVEKSLTSSADDKLESDVKGQSLLQKDTTSSATKTSEVSPDFTKLKERRINKPCKFLNRYCCLYLFTLLLRIMDIADFAGLSLIKRKSPDEFP